MVRLHCSPQNLTNIMKLIMSLQKLTVLPAENLAQHNMTHIYGDPVQQKYLEK